MNCGPSALLEPRPPPVTGDRSKKERMDGEESRWRGGPARISAVLAGVDGERTAQTRLIVGAKCMCV